MRFKGESEPICDTVILIATYNNSYWINEESQDITTCNIYIFQKKTLVLCSKEKMLNAQFLFYGNYKLSPP